MKALSAKFLPAEAQAVGFRKLIPPMWIVLFLALTLAGIYYVRKMILERAMADAVSVNDEKAVAALARGWPSPVNARITLRRIVEGPVLSNRGGPAAKLFTAAEIVQERCTALHWAVDHGNGGLSALLIRCGADVNSKDSDVRTSLHKAARNGCRETAELLIAKGADVNVKDDSGKTALQLAVDEKHDAVAELLRQAARIGHSMRTKVHIAWLGPALRLEARDRRLELRPTPEGVVAVETGNGGEIRSRPVDLQGNPEALLREWLGAPA